MTSTKGFVVNNTGVSLSFVADNDPDHGAPPTILITSLPPGGEGTVFIANSDGAGVEGWVQASGNGATWQLNYDNPVIGSNSGSVSKNPGTCDVGSGVNNTNTYTLNPRSTSKD
ncbi:hypothetical protein [Burkholderia gladioli]|uniref:hypothetical protein n=1 Tax=Burkholderia gladioli TaxID=28095 RepID=UPI001641283F|nr:hypothetical protein [Burkholderia gladioli]